MVSDISEIPGIDDPELAQKIKEWLLWDKNESDRKKVLELVEKRDIDGLKDRMLGRVVFGTAGMRAKMDAGFNRLNDLTIIQTTQGLLSYMKQHCPALSSNGIIIGFDGRYNSERFARLAANVFILNKVKVHLFSKMVPTPFVSFGVMQLGCDAGIVITASHNPKEDNGYKLYWNNGAQILSPHDKQVCAEALNFLEPMEGVWDLYGIFNSDLCKDPYDDIMKLYRVDARKFCFYKDLNTQCPIKFTYTAFHGVGGSFTPRVIEDFGFPRESLVMVKEQIDADPDFPTVKNPNPEEGMEVLELSFNTANACGSTVIVANDPDADRLEIAEKQTDGKWRVLSGNELGALLAWWVWHGWQKKNEGTSGKDVYLLNSAVSSKFVQTMAEVEGFNYEETLTGFKWMGHRTDELRKLGKTVLLTWEESIGYMPGNTLDKDGVLSAAMFCEYAAYLQRKGLNLAGQLDYMYQKYGYHLNCGSYVICKESEIKKKIFEKVRNFNGIPKTYPAQIGKYAVKYVRDLTVGFDNSQPNNEPILPSSKSNQMITFTLSNGSVVTLRASGTEPKIKWYIELKSSPGLGKDELLALKSELREFENEVIERFIEPEKYGLSRQH